MQTVKSQESADLVLQRFLDADNAAAAGQCLEELISTYAEPVIRKITRFKLCYPYSASQSSDMQDEEDVRSHAVLQLISRLHELRKAPESCSIENFTSYVAGITYNSCNYWLRTRYPARWQLKNRLRYLLNHRPKFALWESENKQWLCGFKAWKQKSIRPSKEANQPDLAQFSSSLPAGQVVTQMKAEELLHALFTWRGQPIELEELVSMVASLWNIRDPQPESNRYEDENVDICDLLQSTAPDAASQFERRTFLEKLWSEICELPARQRTALLLNLRDAHERDALILFTLTGITSMQQIATILDIPLEEFAGLWNQLPLDDLSIAGRLGLSRQQVINLRKSARERLARRMAAY